MAEPIRVLHFINQFFGGIGGEEHANVGVEVREGAVGLGRALQLALGDAGAIVATVIGGDNYMVEHEDEAIKAVGEAIATFQPGLVVAGPAFDAGRYGLACAAVCVEAQSRGIPAVTSMHPDNPGVLTHRKELLAVPTGIDVTEMRSIVARMARLGLKAASGQELGPAVEDDYISRGFRKSAMREKTGAEAAIDMLEARVTGKAFVSEVYRRDYDPIPVPDPIDDLSGVTLALISTGGLVPMGNPDHLEQGRTTEFAGRYDVSELKEFTITEWETIHTTQGNVPNETDTNYLMPLRSLRELEARGEIGGLYPYFFSTAGNGMAVKAATRIGEEIAEELTDAGVEAALLVAT